MRDLVRAAGRLPSRWRARQAWRRTIAMVGRSGLFDPDWYRMRYPDIGLGIDPLRHYMTQGAAEQRDPGPLFDAKSYLRAWPDAALSTNGNPLLHFLLEGRALGATPGPAPPEGAGCLPLTDAGVARWRVLHRVPAPGQGVSALPRVLFPDGDAEGASPDRLILVLPARATVMEGAEPLLARYDQDGIDLVVADDVTGGDEYGGARFKPEWDPAFFEACDLLSAGIAIRGALLPALLRAGREGATLTESVLVSLGTSAHPRVAGLSELLFDTPVAPAPRSAVSPLPDPPAWPRVSVIVPTRDRADLLAQCIAGLLHQTDYPDVELLVIDNESRERATRRLFASAARDARVRVIAVPGPFNWSALNNRGAACSTGSILLLLNNDIAVLEPGWLRQLVRRLAQPGVGAVGAKLLYPNRTVQHAGIAIGLGAAAAHLFRGVPDQSAGYLGMLAVPRRVAAVTGACLAIPRAVFEAVGGLDETQLQVTYNDIDLCFRVRARSLAVMWEPAARLLHYELATRGPDLTPEQNQRRLAERRIMVDRWGEMAQHDPHLSPNLAVVRESLMLAPPG